jgi:hypothetical protein
MTIDRLVMFFAGMFILVSICLSLFFSLNWLWLTGFVGLNLVQASFTGFCPLVLLLKRFGVKPGCAF